MDIKETQVTDQNRAQFYQALYPHQMESKENLIDIGAINVDNIIAIDCCGWHYKNLFPEKNVLAIDPIKTALEFKLDKDKIHKLVDNRLDDKDLSWPKFSIDNNAVIFDRSPMLKYLRIDQLVKLFNDVQHTYKPKFLIARLNLVFIDSNRLTDRFADISTIRVDNSVVDRFFYDASKSYLYVCFRKKYDYSN